MFSEQEILEMLEEEEMEQLIQEDYEKRLQQELEEMEYPPLEPKPVRFVHIDEYEGYYVWAANPYHNE